MRGETAKGKYCITFQWFFHGRSLSQGLQISKQGTSKESETSPTFTYMIVMKCELLTYFSNDEVHHTHIHKVINSSSHWILMVDNYF